MASTQKEMFDVKHRLPIPGKYVLVHIKKSACSWSDREDPDGVYFDVAKLVSGISSEDREKMKKGEIPEPEPGRAKTIKGEDEWGNNLVPYNWITFGPNTYFGQDIDLWMELPNLLKS